MKTKFMGLALAACIAATPAAWAEPADEARRLYDRFVSAQNTSDFGALETILLNSQHFVWVTNGFSIWGRDAAIQRMSAYHTAEIWHIDADIARSVAVEVDARAAYLHVTLDLTIGAKADGPDHFRFLVSALCVETPQGWRIAALFTTAANPEQK